MASSDGKKQLLSNSSASPRCVKEGGGDSQLAVGALPRSAASNSPTAHSQSPLCLRRARPGGHFLPPRRAPHQPLAQANRLFHPSTLQPPRGLPRGSRGGTKAASGMRRADACVCSKSAQQRPSGASPLRARDASRREASVTSSGEASSETLFSDSQSCTIPGLLGASRSRADAEAGDRQLHEAAVYLQAFQRIKAAANSGKNIASAGRNADVSMKGVPPLKIFCGTWNCQYQEFPVDVLVNRRTANCLHASADSPGAAATGGKAPPSVYVHPPDTLPEEVPADVIAKLDGDFESLCASDGRGEDTEEAGAFLPTSSKPTYAHLGLPEGGRNLAELPLTRKGTISRDDLVRSSTKLLRAVEGEEQPLADWVLPGYDVYIIALQETLGHTIFEAITVYLTTVNGFPYKRIRFQEDKLSGLGDGAWMQFKSTSEDRNK
ncbi:hypothetical protein Efla_005817 [Eimeria flavescens]